MSALERALAYHERTKHRPGRYARSLGYMDWATQPDPFRRFEGAPLLELDEAPPTDAPSLDAVLAGSVPTAAPLDRAFVSQLFYDSLALSAWKEAGSSRWSLRVNPSSGNLHPTEGYLIAPAIEGLSETPGLFHYAPHPHALELRRTLPEPPSALFVGLTSIHWREAWKYGERAFRYCQHDVGHAIGALAIAASTLGWETRLCETMTDDELARLLGVDQQSGPEAERADCLLTLFPRGGAAAEPIRPTTGEWLGKPLPLSPEHHDWPVIDEVARDVEKREPLREETLVAEDTSSVGLPPVSARKIVRQRRSAVDMDGESRLGRATFLRQLALTLPGRVPFRALAWRPRVHLALFVHRVDELEPGLYFFARDAEKVPALRNATRPELMWEPVEGAADLFLLVPADVRTAAKMICCHQDIAADSAFAVAMIAELEPSLVALGPCMYSRLHWEAGAIGQVLYLGAEAEGLRATGIGCFFDDVMHDLLGLSDRRFQALYCFTVGGPVEDSRLRTAPAYAHRAGRP